jgi:hypothetical protein
MMMMMMILIYVQRILSNTAHVLETSRRVWADAKLRIYYKVLPIKRPKPQGEKEAPL